MRLMRDARSGKIDRILVKSISRFARNTKDCLENVRELKCHNVTVFFEKENIDTGKISSEMLLSMFGAMAQEESISISRNIRWSYERRIRDGSYTTDKAAYGYDLHKTSLVINPAEAEVVNRIFAEFLTGKSTTEIAIGLNQNNIPNKSGSVSWIHTSVSYILKNEKYIGDALVQKTFSTDTFPAPKLINTGQKDKFYIRNSHQPIISREQFSQAKGLLESKMEQFFPMRERSKYALAK